MIKNLGLFELTVNDDEEKTSEDAPPYCDMERFCDICIGNVCMRTDFAECPHFNAMKCIEDLEHEIELYRDQEYEDYDW